MIARIDNKSRRHRSSFTFSKVFEHLKYKCGDGIDDLSTASSFDIIDEHRKDKKVNQIRNRSKWITIYCHSLEKLANCFFKYWNINIFLLNYLMQCSVVYRWNIPFTLEVGVELNEILTMSCSHHFWFDFMFWIWFCFCFFFLFSLQRTSLHLSF